MNKAKLTKEVTRIKADLLHKLAHARLDLDRAYVLKGDGSTDFLWRKCRVETLEEVLRVVDPTQEYVE